MTTVTLHVDKSGLDGLAADLRRLLEGGAAAKAGGMELEGCIKDHVGRLARSRHNTASRLGASPTGHYREEAVNLRSAAGNAAVVAVAIPGIARAYRDITIRPVRGSALTIPIHAWAYGRTVREVRDSGRPVFKIKGLDVLATAEGGELIELYRLRRVVRQRRDRSLMPSDTALRKAFSAGVSLAVETLAGRAP